MGAAVTPRPYHASTDAKMGKTSAMATTRVLEPMELRLAVADGGATCDVVVNASADVAAGELVAALAQELGSAEQTATLRGEPVPDEVPLSELDLRWGDTLVLGSASRTAPPRAVLTVVGGPEAGHTIPLPAGTHRIGRDASVSIDDPSLSATHVVVTVGGDGAVTVADAGSRNGTLLDGEPLSANEERPYADGSELHAGRSLLRIDAPRRARAAGEGTTGGTVRVNRPPRVRRPLEQTIRPFPAPPGDPQRGRLPLAASLVPLLLGVGLYLLTHLPTMLFFSLLSPVMAVTSFMEDRRSGRKGYDSSRRSYREKLVDLRQELASERAAELAARRAAAPSLADLIARAETLDPALWERRPGDPDFMTLRVGAADQPSLLEVRVDAGGNAELRRELDELAAWFAHLPAVPLAIDLREPGTVGIAGRRDRVEGLARALVAQAAALHSPRDLAVAAALGPDAEERWDWLKWLPHTTDAGAGARARPVWEQVAALAASRRAEADAGGAPAERRLPHVLLVADEASAPERALAARVLSAADCGITVLWLGRERRDLPGECGVVVELDEDSARATVTETGSGRTNDDVSVDGLPLTQAVELALALAPLRDPEQEGAHGIPARVSLLDLLGAGEIDAERLLARWEEADGLTARLGAAAGRPFAVDLRADGPHALIAGTTGAGKSELLQTLIASLAATQPPSRLTFLLVDYKGGAAFKDCDALPHTVGLVTDLDAHLTRRALQSLNAELQRRERILREANAKDLAELERRAPDAAPASLVIVIDEFATLAKEVPDFVDGIVDVAQRGRSLGVHLVLATQRPGGVVSENIRANTNLRIALRVNEAAESTDVIGAPDAARIARDRPGRAYARTGHGELTELQTAYAGAVQIGSAETPALSVERFVLGGRARVAAGRPVGETDLARLVQAAQAAAVHLGLEAPRSPWLEPLPAALDPGALGTADDPARVPIGLLDEPDRQAQRPLVFDLEQDGSMLVYGAGGSGKTTLLRALATALCARLPAEQLHVYGLDFATRALTPLEALPQVGAVIGGEEQERVERLFGLLRKTIERRKLQLAQAGAFTLSEYPETLPRILVLLDGYGGFVSTFERVDLGRVVDALPRLVADGRPLGVHFAITADRRGAVPNALAGIVPMKIVLRMADEDEFAALGVEPRAVRGAQLPPGRGFLPGGIELQIAEPVQLPPTLDGARGAPAIEPLPTHVDRDALPPATRAWSSPLGISDAELEPHPVDFADRHFLVIGPYRSGRSTALATLVEGLRASTPGLELHLLAPRRSPLAELGGWTSVATGAECDDAASRLVNELDGRRPALVVIDDGEELADSLGGPALETLVRRGRDLPIRVLAASERQAAQRAFAGWLRELRKEEHGLLLDPDPDVDGDILGTRLPRRSNPVFPPGRGYVVERGTVELVQVAGAPG